MKRIKSINENLELLKKAFYFADKLISELLEIKAKEHILDTAEDLKMHISVARHSLEFQTENMNWEKLTQDIELLKFEIEEIKRRLKNLEIKK